MILDAAVKPAQKVLNHVFGATDKKNYLKEKTLSDTVRDELWHPRSLFDRLRHTLYRYHISVEASCEMNARLLPLHI